jgi:hypothetical protein
MSTYPDYVHQTLAHARDIGQWYCGQSDAAALCFDVLALFPDCEELQAHRLVKKFGGFGRGKAQVGDAQFGQLSPGAQAG